ncbi:MAG: radical SAM protein [bacterium]
MLKKIKNLIGIFSSVYYYKKRSIKLPYLPNAIWIEPTNVCNLKCIMCPNSIIQNSNPGFMDLNLYKKIIDEAEDFVSYAVLCLSGESLLNKNFPEMVDYAKRHGIYTYLSTNATLLTPKISRQIIQAGLNWINFSFDGVSREIYEKIRVNADFEKTVDNIINFLKIKKELNADVQAELQIMIMDKKGEDDFKNNKEDFFKKFEGLPLDGFQVRKPSTWGGFLAGTDKYTPIEYEKSGRYSPCSYLWGSLHILWDGRIVACTSDFFGDNIFGKFPEKTLKEIWNGELMCNFRKAMVDGTYLEFNKNCKDCDAIWEKKILGLPCGLRGICAITFSNIFGRKFLIWFKNLAKYFNHKFAMEMISIKKK